MSVSIGAYATSAYSTFPWAGGPAAAPPPRPVLDTGPAMAASIQEVIEGRPASSMIGAMAEVIEGRPRT